LSSCYRSPMTNIEPLVPYARLVGIVLVAGAVTAGLYLLFRFGIVFAIRGIVRFTPYDPEPTSGRSNGSGDRGVLLFTRAIRRVSNLLPGTPRSNPFNIIIPLLVVGLPTAILLVVGLVGLPLATAAFVASLGPDALTLPLAVSGIALYYGAFLGLLGLWKRIPELRDDGLASII
jgi:hypothetical protein